MAIGPYKVVYVYPRDFAAGREEYAKQMEQAINQQAAQGWEFVHSTMDNDSGTGIFLYFKKHNAR